MLTKQVHFLRSVQMYYEIMARINVIKIIHTFDGSLSGNVGLILGFTLGVL